MSKNDFLTTAQLAKKWKMAPHTLECWRSLGRGPKFHKFEYMVLYHVRDIKEYELKKTRAQSI